jgi:hypothetical protein
MYPNARNLAAQMTVSSKQPDPNPDSGKGRSSPALRGLWPVLIELWVAGILAAFFIIRVLGSNMGQSILNRLRR